MRETVLTSSRSAVQELAGYAFEQGKDFDVRMASNGKIAVTFFDLDSTQAEKVREIV